MASIGYGYGSEWHLLQHLGRRREAFTRHIEHVARLSAIEWCDSEEYFERDSAVPRLREARGVEFLDPSDPIRLKWESLWPQSGNVHNWDAVGRSTSGVGSWVLLEAKAHLGELKSFCAAKDPESIASIQASLEQTKVALGVTSRADWAEPYYQYCNRLFLLNFLRNHEIDAHLVFIYFSGDRADLGVPGRECPDSETAWSDALEKLDSHTAIRGSAQIHNFIHSVFLTAYHANIAEKVLKPEYYRPEADSDRHTRPQGRIR